jgi:hypothetical protein
MRPVFTVDALLAAAYGLKGETDHAAAELAEARKQGGAGNRALAAFGLVFASRRHGQCLAAILLGAAASLRIAPSGATKLFDGLCACSGYAPLTGPIATQLSLPDPKPKLVVPDYDYANRVQDEVGTWWNRLISHG